MSASDQKDNPGFLEYIYKLTESTDLTEALDQSLQAMDALDMEKLSRIGLKTYADGKWTVHKILQHLIDWERIWCYRTILFARCRPDYCRPSAPPFPIH